MSSRSPSRSVRTIVLGAFELIEPIARGGMGEVWRGRHTIQGVEVAVKLLDGTREGESLRAFEREVAYIARLDHPGIVRLYDFGLVDAGVEKLSGGALVAGTPYLVMELASRSLSQVQMPLRWEQLRTLLLSLLDALSHAHARGVVHRDLKPANILFDVRRGATGVEQLAVKITDFGIAHALLHTLTETRSEGFSGTPAYVAPEQLLGTRRDIGPWTDLYSLGVMAYELGCGQLPFGGPTLIGLIQAHVTHAPRPFDGVGYPPGFVAWLGGLLAKSPADRFQHAADAAWALCQLCEPSPDDEDDEADGLPSVDIDLVSEAFAAVSLEGDRATRFDNTVRETFSADGQSVTFQSSTLSALSFAQLAAVDVPEATAERLQVLGAAAITAPIPSTWRLDVAPQPESPAMRLLGAGLRLLDMRLPPMVGREAERDAVWASLVAVHTTNRPHAVLLRGGHGLGKTRLSQWLAMRSYELGASHVLRAHVQRLPMPGGGLVRGVARLLQLRGEAPGPARERVRAFLRTGCAVLDSASRRADRAPGDEAFERQVDAVLALVAPLLDHHHPHPQDGQLAAARRAELTRTFAAEAPLVEVELSVGERPERHEAMAALLRTVCRLRPVVFWIDNAHLDASVLELARDLLDEAGQLAELPVLLVIALDDEELSERPVESALVASLGSHRRATTLQLEPLGERDQVRLLRGFLGIEEALAHDVNRRTGGNPARAIALVREWSERGLLEPSSAGFRLRERLDEVTAARSVSGVWDRRILASAHQQALDAVQQALELAAALGPAFTRRDWRAVCDAAGLDLPADLLERLAQRDFLVRVERDESGAASAVDGEVSWRFATEALYEAVSADARDAGRWHLHHRLCARTLGRRDVGLVGAAERLACHLREAGEFERAIDALLDAALDRLGAGNAARALELLAQREMLLTQQAAPATDARWARGWLVRARVRLRTGELASAVHDIGRAAVLADTEGDVELQAEACWARGYQALVTGEAAIGRAAFGEALRLFRETRDGVGVARAHAGLGELCRVHGELEESVAQHRQAANLYRALGDRAGIGRSLTALAQVQRLLGNDEAAEALVLDALPFLREVRDDIAVAHNLNLCGALARSRGALGEALRYHQEAWRLFSAHGAAEAVVAELELGLVLLDLKDYAQARHHLQASTVACEQQGRVADLGAVHVGLMACAARDGAWAEFDAQLAGARRALEQHPTFDDTIARAAQRAGELAAEVHETARARGALELASRQWRALDRARELVEVMRLVAGLGA